MVAHVKGCSAIEAAEQITGERRPDRSRDESPKERDARLERDVKLAAEAEARAEKQRAAEAEKARCTARLIKAYIREIGPVRRSPGERYLAEERKIDTDAIRDVLERTDALGWHPSLYFNEPGHPLHGQKLGAIIGVMTDPITALPTGAISRTYLDREGRKVLKAKTLGSPPGLIRLSEYADVLSGLHLAEGLENGLTAMARGFRPLWVTAGKGLLRTFPLLADVQRLTVFADNDPNGDGVRAANEVTSRWLQAGRKAYVIVRDGIGDINDALRAARDEP
jgi:Toprim domain